MASFIRTNDHLTIVFSDGKSITVYPSNPNYEGIVKALRDEDEDQVKTLALPAEKLKQEFAKTSVGSTRVSVTHGIVHLDGKEMHNVLTTRILQMLKEGFDVGPMSKFLENLMGNPSYRAVNELYGFLEHSNLPITDDGHFLAYKRVRGDYKDIHSGTFDNSVGKTCEMPRNAVDEDKNRTCSVGLHFCSRGYLTSYGIELGSRSMIVKINPADVVSIPAEYGTTKGRCCKYVVIGELKHRDEAPLEGLVHKTPTSVLLVPDNEEFPEDDEPSAMIPPLNPRVVPETGIHSPVAKNASSSMEEGAVFGTYLMTQAQSTYSSVAEASKSTGVSASDIRRVCNGGRKTAGGWTWIWA